MISQLAAQVPDLVAFPLVGLLAGLAIGLTGMGGGVLLTPIMVLFLGVPPNVAVSNDLLISLAVKPVGALTHSRAGTVRSDMVLRLAVGSVPAAFLGALLVNTWFADRRRDEVPDRWHPARRRRDDDRSAARPHAPSRKQARRCAPCQRWRSAWSVACWWA